ncbi:MAG: hypothetical protein E7C49_12635 [Clostridium sp.]|nr:hypothetical protein [Clostridium sp.]
MAQYHSFIFEGHGRSEKTGAYDPGAISGNTRENDLADAIVTSAMNYLKQTNLNIHRDENNYVDEDLVGNSYSAKGGIVVHINAGGGSGAEIFVPSKEKYLTTDFQIVSELSQLLNISNRGVKSRDYNSEKIFNRQDGQPLNYTDYYKEIRNAWNQGVSLAILEVGFIDTGDLQKIKANIDGIGFLVAKYVASLCDVKLTKPVGSETNNKLYRVMGGSYSIRENAEKQVNKLKAAGFDATIMIFNEN